MLEQALMSFGILFLFAIIGSFIASKAKQPAVIGLLLIGAIIGPNALNFVNNKEIIDMMAELGSILLLFVIGLEFVLPKLAKIGFKALLIGVLKIGMSFFITYEAVVFIGLSQQIALVLGVMLSVSSTVVIVKVLESKGLYERQEMPLLIGVLLMEDIFAVIVLTSLGSMQNSTGLFVVLEKLIFALTVMTVTYIVMLKILPKIFSILTEDSNEEMSTFIALGTCAAFSYLAFILGLSPATGAFIAGSIVASLPQVKIFEHAIRPYTLTFSSLFFIAIGSMVNFSEISNNLTLLLVLGAAIVISRFIAVGFVSYLFANFTRHQVMFSSMAMVSVGEFSLLIAKMASGLDLGIDFVSIAAFIIFLTAIIMSLTINYYQQATDLFVASNPYSKPRSFSNFMRLLTEELDTESSHSQNFKIRALKSSFFSLFVLFIVGAARHLSEYIKFLGISHNYTILCYVVVGGIGVIFAIMAAVNFFSMYNSLISIITNLDSTGNKKRSQYILNNLLFVLILLLTTAFAPALIPIFKLPEWINLASFVLMLIVIIRFNRMFNYLHYSAQKDFFPCRHRHKI
jgi:monovalent cation:H+ antiporter-2, CPA2 family